MKPTSKTLSWAFVIILLAVGIFTGLGVILMHKQPLVLQGQAEATEIRISGKLPGRIDTFFVQEGDWVHQGDTLVVINSPEVHVRIFCRWRAPASLVTAERYRPGRPDGLVTNGSVDENALSAKDETAGRSSRMAYRSFSFAAFYSWSNRSSTRCRVMPSSEAAANASATLSLGTTIKTYSSPPVSHSRIVRP